jgi:tetratricopeptide (TPR) repeat protein
LHADDDPAGAMLELEKALFDNPADYGAALLLGKIARGQGRTELAIEALRLATQIEEETDEPWLELARLSLSTGQLDQAEQLARRVLRLNPKRALAHNILGRVWLSRSHWQRAIQAFEAALELSPNSSYFRNNLGYALLLKKDHVRAVEVLEPLGARAGIPAYMHNNLGLAYEGAGRLPEAVAAYKRSLGVRPGYVNAQVNLDRLVQVAKRADAKVQGPDPVVESSAPDSDPEGPAEDLILPEMDSL